MTMELTLACGDYDRTRALRTGDVRPEGIDVNYLTIPPAETFVRMEAYAEFQASEMSLSAYIIGLSKGDDRFVGIPAFPSRVFRHRDIYVRNESGIESPEDLRGRRVGIHRYHMTALLWQRGLLAEDYGVKPQDITWVKAGVNLPGVPPRRLHLNLPSDVQVEQVTDRSIDEMLVSGDIDAAILGFPPPSFTDPASGVRRLFGDVRNVELAYYRRTHIFPIMHLVVLRRDVYESAEWAAQSLLAAFQRSKYRAYDLMRNFGYSESALPFFHLDLEEIRQDFGEDFWAYGVHANTRELEAAVRYSYEQGMSERPVDVAELFPATAQEPWSMDAIGVLPGSAGAEPPSTEHGLAD